MYFKAEWVDHECLRHTIGMAPGDPLPMMSSEGEMIGAYHHPDEGLMLILWNEDKQDIQCAPAREAKRIR